jgi:site-specific recombinase XerD
LEKHREPGKSVVNGITYTATPQTRHDDDCPKKAEGGSYPKCDCRKAVIAYDSSKAKLRKSEGKPANWRLTVADGYIPSRSWTKAHEAAESWLDKFDPDKIQKAKKESAKVTVQEALEAFLEHLKQLGVDDKGLVKYKSELGGRTRWVRKKTGKLVDFLAQHHIQFIADVTAAHLTKWRNTWTSNDLTSNRTCGNVLRFFKFCEDHKWLEGNPAPLAMKKGKVAQGNRTMPFTDEQYDAILTQAKKAKDARLLALLELLRWSGTAMVDAILFNRKCIGSGNVLEYQRDKTDKRATITLPGHVVKLVRSLPSEEEYDDQHPFRRLNPTFLPTSDVNFWRRKLQELFTKAGIKSIETLVKGKDGKFVCERPAPRMLRDTCAVWYLRHGATIDEVAVYLGYTVKVVETYYSPWVEELKNARMKRNQQILKKASLA